MKRVGEQVWPTELFTLLRHLTAKACGLKEWLPVPCDVMRVEDYCRQLLEACLEAEEITK